VYRLSRRQHQLFSGKEVFNAGGSINEDRCNRNSRRQDQCRGAGKALKKFVQELEKAQKTASQPKTYRGKQTVKHLVSRMQLSPTLKSLTATSNPLIAQQKSTG
jgi:hypothetical protein